VSGVSPVQRSEAQAAIARASAATGVDFNFLLAQAKLESNLDPNARASASSAAGLYQFIGGTWLETLSRHGTEHGLDWAGTAISSIGGRATISDPGVRAQVMALRYDPDVSALMAAELTRDNAAELSGFLGREPEPAELYLAHFLGSAGARTFLGALQNSPDMSAAALFPKPAAANQAIFFDGGRARAVGEVMDLMKAKVGAAMGDSVAAVLPGAAYAYAAPTRAFEAAQADFAPSAPAPRRVSMAETLQATFGGSDRIGARAAQRIDEAYGKFRAFGL
jgi:hypothetical protein